MRNAMMGEYFLMRELMGTSGLDWLAIALFLSFFVVSVFKPDQIRKRQVFRWACCLLAVSFVIPSASQMVMQSLDLGLAIGRRSSYPDQTVNSAIFAIGTLRPLCLGGSVLLGLLAVSPRSNPTGKRHGNTKSNKHPLD